MQHKTLEDGRWANMPFIEQMANIGSEISRTANWKEKGNEKRHLPVFWQVSLFLSDRDPQS